MNKHYKLIILFSLLTVPFLSVPNNAYSLTEDNTNSMEIMNGQGYSPEILRLIQMQNLQVVDKYKEPKQTFFQKYLHYFKRQTKSPDFTQPIDEFGKRYISE